MCASQYYNVSGVFLYYCSVSREESLESVMPGLIGDRNTPGTGFVSVGLPPP